MRIALTGGGTGGHLFPILAVTEEIKKLVQANIFQIPPGEGTDIEFMFIGPPTIGEEALAKAGISRKFVLAGKIRRFISARAVFQNILDIFKMPVGIFQALWHLFIFMPNVIFSKGGYGSVPVVIAAWIWHIPVLIHESDAIPGLANRFSAKLAQRIAISFMDTAHYFPETKTALTGNPVRGSLFGASKEGAQKMLGLDAQKKTLLVLGGSQGAQAINDVIFAALPGLLERCNLIHQCGPNNFEPLKQLLNNRIPPGYLLYPFLDEDLLRESYAAADLVVSRAGAGTIAEIAALGKPSIVIPLPNSASEHQLKNATEYAHFGAALIIEQMNLTPNLFQSEIFGLIFNAELLAKMGENAQKFSQQNASQKIAQELMNIAKF